MDGYWNHNAAYHPWLVDIAARRHGDVLDVGCGEGLLAPRLAAVSRSVVGIDPDPEAARRAHGRLQFIDNASVEPTGFQSRDADERSYDLITLVASLHHLPLRATLQKARRMLNDGGELAIVGLSANKSIADWAWAALCTPAARAGSRLHRGRPATSGWRSRSRANPSLKIRRVTDDVLPGAVIRRGLYYRYRLYWRNH